MAWAISAAYVIAATVNCYWSVRYSSEEDLLDMFFLPASFLPELVLLAERDPWPLLLLFQGVTTVIVWLLVRAILYWLWPRGTDGESE